MFAAIASVIPLHDAPGPVGSAFINGWYGYVNKDLRTVLDSDDVSGRFSRTYCGRGKLRKCRKALVRSLGDALGHTSDAELYPGETL